MLFLGLAFACGDLPGGKLGSGKLDSSTPNAPQGNNPDGTGDDGAGQGSSGPGSDPAGSSGESSGEGSSAEPGGSENDNNTQAPGSGGGDDAKAPAANWMQGSWDITEAQGTILNESFSFVITSFDSEHDSGAISLATRVIKAELQPGMTRSVDYAPVRATVSNGRVLVDEKDVGEIKPGSFVISTCNGGRSCFDLSLAYLGPYLLEYKETSYIDSAVQSHVVAKLRRSGSYQMALIQSVQVGDSLPRVPLLGTAKITYSLKNTGTVHATSISVVLPDSGLRFAGGAYPGTGGTCGTSLVGGSSCSVSIEVDSSGFSVKSHVIRVGYASLAVQKEHIFWVSARSQAFELRHPSDFDFTRNLHGTICGRSLAIDGDLALVGGTQSQDYYSGGAYAYRFDGKTWVLESVLALPSNTITRIRSIPFVALRGDLALVAEKNKQQAALFVREANTWVKKSGLPGVGAVALGDGWAMSGLSLYEGQGNALALKQTLALSGGETATYQAIRQGDWLFIGGQEIGWTNPLGPVYIFKLKPGGFEEVQKIDVTSEQFSVHGSTLLVGGGPNDTAPDVYRLEGDVWVKTAGLSYSNPPRTADDRGAGVFISSDLALVTAPRAKPSSFSGYEGEFYVFKPDATGTGWEQKLRSSSPSSGASYFGRAVTISGPWAAGTSCGAMGFVFGIGP